MEQKVQKKRVLRNIRKNFVNKKPENDQDLAAPLWKNVDDDKFRMIDTSIGLMEKDRKILVGVRYLNPFVKINKVSLETGTQKQAVTLSLGIQENSSMLPWEYHVKRLESYGDLDLVTWAYKIKSFHSKYNEIMTQYFDAMNSDDPNIIEQFIKTKEKAVLASKQIESSYAYKKVTIFLGKSAPKLTAVSYSEAIIKQLGHSTESFISNIKENGIPTLFKGDCFLHLDIGKKFLECASMNKNTCTEWPECSTFIYDRHGRKQKVLAQLAGVVHPTSEGLLLDGYLIINNKLPDSELNENEGEKKLYDGNKTDYTTKQYFHGQKTY